MILFDMLYLVPVIVIVATIISVVIVSVVGITNENRAKVNKASKDTIKPPITIEEELKRRK